MPLPLPTTPSSAGTGPCADCWVLRRHHQDHTRPTAARNSKVAPQEAPSVRPLDGDLATAPRLKLPLRHWPSIRGPHPPDRGPWQSDPERAALCQAFVQGHAGCGPARRIQGRTHPQGPVRLGIGNTAATTPPLSPQPVRLACPGAARDLQYCRRSTGASQEAAAATRGSAATPLGESSPPGGVANWAAG